MKKPSFFENGFRFTSFWRNMVCILGNSLSCVMFVILRKFCCSCHIAARNSLYKSPLKVVLIPSYQSKKPEQPTTTFSAWSTTRMFASRSNSCENEKSCISSGSETRCALCRIIWMQRTTMPTTHPSTSGPKRNNAFARRWSLTVSFFVQILHQSGALCKTNLNTLLCKVSFLFRAFLLECY